MSEPKKIVAGDSVSWVRDCVSGEAGDVFTYYLIGPSNQSIVAVLSGSELTAQLSATDSAELEIGNYRWSLVKSNGAERITLDTGFFIVKPDPTAENVTSDNLVHAEKILAAIEATLEGRALKDRESYSIAGRQLDHIPFEQLRAARKEYAHEVDRLKIKRGLKKPRRKIVYG